MSSSEVLGLSDLNITPQGGDVWNGANPIMAKELRMRRKLILTAKKRGVNIAGEPVIISSDRGSVVTGLTLTDFFFSWCMFFN